MTWPTEQAREAVDRTIGAWSLDDAEDREHQTDTVLDALAPHVAALVRAERAAVEGERDDLARRLSYLLCDLTRGRMSKTNYDVPTMTREIDAAYEEAWESERAAVWDEGFAAGYADGTNTGPTSPANPYAEEAGR